MSRLNATYKASLKELRVETLTTNRLIAKLCGYTSLGTLLRIFKKAIGQTLSEFRRKKKTS